MKNIINWTLGGFFRSIGRYLAIFVIFIAITFILSISGLKLPSWLSFQVVNAVSTDNWLQQQDIEQFSYINYYSCSSNSSCSSNITLDVNTEVMTNTNNSWTWYGNADPVNVSTNGIILSGNIATPQMKDYLYSVSFYTCSNKNLLSLLSSYDVYNYNGATFPANNSLSGKASIKVSTVNNISTVITIANTHTFNYCQQFKFLYVPTQTSTSLGLRLKPTSAMNSTGIYTFGYQIDELGIYTSAIESIINSSISNSGVATASQLEEVEDSITEAQQGTTDAVDNLTDTFTDTDTTSDTSDASDWFHDFSLSIETPISDIVLLPINFLQQLLIDYNSTSSHADLCTTFMNKQICLPSGDILWKRSGCHDNSPFGCPNFSAFKTFFQLVVGGFLYYKLLRRLVSSVEKGLDPQESGVNMIKL